MPSWLPSISYPASDQKGFWDPVTSTLQWCEEDYYATYYAAEIVNTLTNLFFMGLAYLGVRSCRKHGHAKIYEIAYMGMFFVSLGSFMFHATLKSCLADFNLVTDPWQLVDELNMIYTTCLMCYASLSYAQPSKNRILLGTGLVALCVVVTVYYHYIQNPVFHQTVYAILTIFIVVRSVWIMEKSLRPSLRHSEESDRLAAEKRGEIVKSKVQQAYENQRDLEILKNLWIFVVFGVTVFVSGFALWGIDNQCCGTLRSWRRSVGMPWGFLLELHGWWHLMTGFGAYCYIAWGIHLRHVQDGNQEIFVMMWPSFFSVPEIVRKDRGNGYINGYAKGYVRGHRNSDANNIVAKAPQKQ